MRWRTSTSCTPPQRKAAEEMVNVGKGGLVSEHVGPLVEAGAHPLQALMALHVIFSTTHKRGQQAMVAATARRTDPWQPCARRTLAMTRASLRCELSAREAHMKTVDVGALLDDGQWGGYQKLLVFATALTIILDGLDNQLLGAAIPALMKRMGSAALGVLLGPDQRPGRHDDRRRDRRLHGRSLRPARRAARQRGHRSAC